MTFKIPFCSESLTLKPRRIALAGLAAIAAFLGALDTGYAEVVSAKARYDGGLVIVRGKTAEPMQFVSLDRVLATRSNRVGRFVFRQSRIPHRCSVLLYSEGRSMTVPIKNCPLNE
ncbi:hypothetical protein [Methyloceanibacter caenitepidi]|uniref:Uncharacterized protein n=1 Tax=Methyloceanibacter caenitepidi TaxID=1384459 RepID=A0A0A8JXV5_9HYPH|nr:hypothetical protein [Methyloceanibacter caenitepidi]BAQ15633.1 hypothetical protein GL4_0163 [Methyloceanibacter caenitepidi]